ncbi:MAG: adenine-specific DNA-methyltransferase [Solirubrobacteraceae bacterium]
MPATATSCCRRRSGWRRRWLRRQAETDTDNPKRISPTVLPSRSPADRSARTAASISAGVTILRSETTTIASPVRSPDASLATRRGTGPRRSVGPAAEATSQGRRHSLRYLGSKVSVAEMVLDEIYRRCPGGSLCDPCGGIGTIATAARRRGFRVYGGDLLHCAVAFQTARLIHAPAFTGLRTKGLADRHAVEQHLRMLPGVDGWIVDEYATARAFFAPENARRIEACRQCIEGWAAAGLVTRRELCVLRASLIASADHVANTAGTYYAHLKQLSRQARRSFELKLLPVGSGPAGTSARRDATIRAAERAYDVLYLDPPYNARSYSGYYHLPESLARGETPPVRGKAGVPDRESVLSAFNAPRRATAALEHIVTRSDCGMIVFHYTNDGFISLATARGILGQVGKVSERVVTAPGYTVRRSEPRRTPHHLLMVNV